MDLTVSTNFRCTTILEAPDLLSSSPVFNAGFLRKPAKPSYSDHQQKLMSHPTEAATSKPRASATIWETNPVHGGKS